MTDSKPSFHLRRISADGDCEPVEVYPLFDLPADMQLSRRKFLGTGLTVASVLSLVNPSEASEEVAQGESAKQSKPRFTKVYAHTDSVLALAMTPNGSTLISASKDKSIKLWSLPEGSLDKTLTGHTGSVNALAVTPDGKTLVSASSDETIKMWSLPDGRLLNDIKDNGRSVNALAVTPNGKNLVSASSDQTIKMRTLPQGEMLQTDQRYSGKKVLDLEITPDGKTLVSAASDGTVSFFSVGDNRTITADSRVDAVAVTQDGNTLATAGRGKTVKLWSLPKAKLRQELQGHTSSVKALVVTPDGETLVSGGTDTTIKLWSLPLSKIRRTLTEHSSTVDELAVTPDGKTLASGDSSGVILLWDLAIGKMNGYLFDPAASSTDAFVYNVKDKLTGNTLTYTLPCGSPIPIGATCVCNCVPGNYVAITSSTGVKSNKSTAMKSERANLPRRKSNRRGYTPQQRNSQGRRYYPGGSDCSCNKICTCVPVYY